MGIGVHVDGSGTSDPAVGLLAQGAVSLESVTAALLLRPEFQALVASIASNSAGDAGIAARFPIGTSDIGTNAVTSGKLATGAVTSAKLASDALASIGGTVTSTKTAAYTATPGDVVPVDASGAARTITLPPANRAGDVVTVKKVDSSTNLVTIARAGSDVINTASTSLTLSLQNQAVSLRSNGSGAWVVQSGDLPFSSLQANLSTTFGRKVAIDVRDYASLVSGNIWHDAINAAITEAAAADGGSVNLPAQTLLVAAPILVKDKVIVRGASRSGTKIRSVPSGFTGNYVCRIGAGTGIVFGSRLENLTLDANDVVNQCLYTIEGQEQSGIRYAVLTGFRQHAIEINGASRYMACGDLELYGSNLGWTYGVYVHDCTGPVDLETMTINTNGEGTIGSAGIYATGVQTNIKAIHGEKVADTVVLGPNAFAVVQSIDGTTGVTGTAVRLTSGHGGGVVLMAVGGVNDQQNGRQLGYTALYAKGNVGSAKAVVTENAPSATIAVNSGAGGSASATIAGTDSAGLINVSMGSSPPAGKVATVTFGGGTRNAAPLSVVLTPHNNYAAVNDLKAWVVQTTTGFEIWANAAASASQSYQWNYVIL